MFLAITLIICTLFVGFFGFLINPVWSLASPSLMWTIFMACGIYTIGISICGYHYDGEWDSLWPVAIAWIVTGSMLLLIAIISFIGSPAIMPNPYRDAVEVKEASFTEDFEDIAQIDGYHLLDLDTARRLGNRVLGNVPNASWYNVSDEYNLIVYRGKQYRISPLVYRDLIAYSRAKTNGIPGYVLVSVDTLEANFIKTDEPIIVSTSGYFSQKLSRVLRGQYPSTVLGDSFMEIDESGHPYWITATMEARACLWGAPIANGYIVTDACTGKSQLYSLEDEMPEWIDHVYSLDYMMSRSAWGYWYVHGWWNGAGTDSKKLTYDYRAAANSEKGIPAFYGYNCFVAKDGRVKVITGVTPINKTESNVGFITVDCATGEAKYYSIPGAEESSAQDHVEGQIQATHYESTFPIMVNIAGEPAYLMNLKDKSGMIQRYAIVNYSNYAEAYVGETFEKTLSGYLELIKKDVVFEEEPVEIFEKQGVILEKYQAEVNGTTFFYYVIDNELFKAPITINEEQITYKPGYTVTLQYSVDGNGMNVVCDVSRE